MPESDVVHASLETLSRTVAPASIEHAKRPAAGHALLLSNLFPPDIGGSAVLFEGIYSRLPEVAVLVLADPGTSPAHGPTHRGPLTVSRRPLAKHWGLLSLRAVWEHLCVATRIRRLISRRDGVVHCARLLPEGLSALIARLLGGPRYVCWAHGEDLVIAQSSRELVFFLRLVLRHAEAVLANSHNTAAMLAKLGVPAARIHVVHPAVDAERFHPAVNGEEIRRCHAAPDDVLLLSVGRLQRRKGHDVAIRAVAALRHELPHLRYLIAGDGEERTRLEQIAAEHGVHDRVSFAGVVADGDLPAYYAACDVFLLPNRVDNGDIEGFGIVFLEAAATGKPVIGGDSGGVPEAVERDITGLLVDGADVDQVAGAIRELAMSESRRRQMGAAGRARAQRQFSWQRAATLVTELQERLAGARRIRAAHASSTARDER